MFFCFLSDGVGVSEIPFLNTVFFNVFVFFVVVHFFV